MNKVRILWSGITGRTGQEALKAIEDNDQAEIVAGICRSDDKYYNYDELDEIVEEFDIAIGLYEKKGMIKEYYRNELESDEINNETIIYSKSLTGEKTLKWNNKFLGLTVQSEKEK